METMETSGNIITRNKGKIALAATLAGAIALGPKVWHAIEDRANPESRIVAGAPGQVETHSTGKHCGVYVKAICTDWVTDYYLGIEQCPVDVQAAKQGHQTASFDPKVGEIYQSCYYDLVKVDATDWQQFPDGATVVFPGNVGEHLHA